jgi:thermitase
MRAGVWAVVVGTALIGSPAAAYADSAEPVSLVVGLRGATGTSVVSSLERRTNVDIVDSAPLSGAVTVDVPADQVTEASDALRADPAVAYVEPDHVAHMSAVTPDDPSYGSQWGTAKTRVNTAWSWTHGAGAVVVAVVDTGVKPMPDLSGRLLPGKDFVNHDDNATDDNGHGTMAAGVIAAAGDNGIGIAGVCWACRILPVKVLAADGSGTYSNIAEGIRYAADQGADIINLSLGGSADGQVLRDAVTYATGKGALVIAAAGNDGSASQHYPAAIPAVLAVGGSTVTDGRYPWSNYGANWVDIAAPGCNPAQQVNGIVGQYCGTSSATPFTAGVAALLASTTPRPTASTIRTALTSSAHPLAGGWVAASSGRIDAAAALNALPFWVSGVVSGQVAGASVTVLPHVGASSGITSVTASVNGTVLATATGAPWALTVDTRQVAGTATLTVAAVSGGTPVGSTALTVHGDHTPPSTSFGILPSDPVRGIVTVRARASDDMRVARVQLLAGGTVVATDTTSPYAFSWPTAPRTGAVRLILRAYDAAGNSATATTVVTSDNVTPAVVVTKAPADGTRGIRGTQYVDARATDTYGVRSMELIVNGKVVQASTGRILRFTVLTGKYGSAMSVRIRAYDRAGNAGLTPARTWYR